jgi:hypothetical protein
VGSYIYTHKYICVLVSPSEGAIVGGREKENIREWKILKQPIYLWIKCTLNFFKWRSGGKNKSFPAVGTNRSRVDTGKGEWGCIWWMCFISIYENRRMKPVENCDKKGGEGRITEGVNPTKIYFNHIYKNHNGSPSTTIIC